MIETAICPKCGKLAAENVLLAEQLDRAIRTFTWLRQVATRMGNTEVFDGVAHAQREIAEIGDRK